MFLGNCRKGGSACVCGITCVFGGGSPWWAYRRVIAAGLFRDPDFRYDLATINTGANDYKGGVFPTGDANQDAQNLAQARQASLGYLYWVQTECPRDENPAKRDYPELKLHTALFGTEDGLSPAPYIRASRRITSARLAAFGPGVRSGSRTSRRTTTPARGRHS